MREEVNMTKDIMSMDENDMILITLYKKEKRNT